MKTTGVILIIVGIGLLGGLIVDSVYANYQYKNQFTSFWELSDKSSTITQKSEYLDKFVSALKDSGLQGSNDSLFFPTPTRSFDQNFIALKSLQSRMHSIIGMDENSFQYQTAMEQITAQEQGQAGDMLDVFGGCWFKVHHYFLWNVFVILGWWVAFIGAIFGGIVLLIV